MKTEWLVANVSIVGSLDRAERAILGGDCSWACFWPIQVVFAVAAPLCDVGTPIGSYLFFLTFGRLKYCHTVKTGRR